jgi:endonuclease/exonuclease/phosphatase family metal-dependent hydrolase
VRLAAFNVQNLFSRPRALHSSTWSEGRQALEDFAELSRLIEAPTYTSRIRSRLLALLRRQLLGPRPRAGRALALVEVRGRLVSRTGGDARIVAAGRGDWVGWFELVRTDLRGAEVINTGRVIDAVRPDVLLVVEAEDRPSLVRFNDQVLQFEFQSPFRSNLLVDGNDARGIDIGLYATMPIRCVQSHTDLARTDVTGPEPVFSRDCPEFEVPLPGGETLLVLGNHFKSQGNGDRRANDRKRLAQSEAVVALYRDARARSPLVVVAGDLNAGPDHPSLAPLLAGTDLRDVMTHPTFTGGQDPRPGTFKSGTSLLQKLDYLLLSPALWSRVRQVGVERRGTWAPRSFPSFPEVTSLLTQASDHACVWVDVG